MKHWTIKHLDELMKAGKIRDYKVNTNKPEKNSQKSQENIPGRKVTRHWQKRSKEKDFIGWNLLYWCNQHAVGLEEEYRFHPERKWAFDWAVPSIKLAIEYEGLFSEKSGHTTVTGYTKDTKKYNAAQAMGWKVLRYTALNYKDLIKELNQAIL